MNLLRKIIFIMGALLGFCPALSLGAEKIHLRCPQLNFGDRTDLKEYKTFETEGYQILICVPPKDVNAGQLTREHLFSYESYLFKKNQFIKSLFSGSQKTAISFERRKGLLYEISYLNLFEKFYPLYESQIKCQKESCEKLQKKCVFRQARQPLMSPHDFELEKTLIAKVETREAELTSQDIFNFLQFALKGREKAIAFFTRQELLPKMDSNGLTVYKNVQKLLESMLVDDCLKPLKD